VILARLTANITAIDAAWSAAQNVAWPGTHFPAGGKNTFMAVDIAIKDVKQAYIGAGAPGATAPTRRIDGDVDLTFFAVQGQSDASLPAHMDKAQDLFPLGLGLTAGAAVLRFLAPIPLPPHENDNEFVLGVLKCPFFTYA
jgi:hypothetical protein